MLCTTWGVNYFLDVVWPIGLPLELNSVISGFHSKSGTSVHFHCNSCVFHPEPCSTFNVLFVSFNSVTVTSHTNKTVVESAHSHCLYMSVCFLQIRLLPKVAC